MNQTALDISIQDRTKGIGGSDIHHLFSLKPYGCARKLWYEKRGIEPDYPFFGNKATERGSKLEAIVANEYREETGRELRISQKCYTYGGWATGHIDLKLTGGRDGSDDSEEGSPNPGVLEIKVPGMHMFRKIKREGLPGAYILQLQHYLMLTGWSWGSYAIFWADGWELLTFDVDKNDKLISEIVKAGTSFWNDVLGNNPPFRLKETDPRCGKCSYRTTCQGQHMLESAEESEKTEPVECLAIPLQEYLEAKEACNQADENLTAIKERIKKYLGKTVEALTIGGKIIYRPIETMRWNTKLLEKDHPELVEKYKQKSISKPLRVYTF